MFRAQKRRLERTRHERASLLSCVGEPLKRDVMRLFWDQTLKLIIFIGVRNIAVYFLLEK
jgi:hypothetical protein